MNIKISIMSSVPIYLQIVEEIKKYIIANNVEGEQLPSIRVLAKELEIGIITVKKAYEQLVIENYIFSKSGVGYFVNKIDFSKLLLENKQKMYEDIYTLVTEGKENKIKKLDVEEIFSKVLKEVYQDEY